MTRPLRLSVLLAALVAAPASASAAELDEIRVALPETVDLAELSPGLQVVTRLDLEVFQQDGAWWLRHNGRWWTSRRPLEGFTAVEARGVPPALARLEAGRYLDYRAAQGQKVSQRRIGAEVAPPAGVQVDAGPAKVAPRGQPAAAPKAEAPPPAKAAEARPAAKPPATGAKPAASTAAKPGAQPGAKPAPKAAPRPAEKKPAGAKSAR